MVDFLPWRSLNFVGLNVRCRTLWRFLYWMQVVALMILNQNIIWRSAMTKSEKMLEIRQNESWTWKTRLIFTCKLRWFNEKWKIKHSYKCQTRHDTLPNSSTKRIFHLNSSHKYYKTCKTSWSCSSESMTTLKVDYHSRTRIYRISADCEIWSTSEIRYIWGNFYCFVRGPKILSDISDYPI